MRCVRDTGRLPVVTGNGRKGQMMSGSSMGYEVHKNCLANIVNEGYKPCSKLMKFSKKEGTFVCDLHGPMH